MDKHPVLNPLEQTRLILVGILTAGDIGAFQLLPSKDSSALGFIKIVLVISATAGLLFILLTAATLKYVGKFTNSNEVGGIPFTDKFRRSCYNYCIDTFGVQVASFLSFSVAFGFGWNFNQDVWDWRVFIGGLASITLVALIIFTVDQAKKRAS